LIKPILSLKDQYIFLLFSQVEARIYEQAIINYYNPLLNNKSTVIFPFINKIKIYTGLDPSYFILLIAFTKDKSFIIFFFESSNVAAKELVIFKTTLNKYINYINYPIKSSVFEKKLYVINHN